MGAIDADLVLFGRGRRMERAARAAAMHLAIVPAPHKGKWTAECGCTMDSTAPSTIAVGGALMIDEGASRTCWLPPGVHMEEVCYVCARRAGATHVLGMWRSAPPHALVPEPAPRIAAAHPPNAAARRRRRMAGRDGRPGGMGGGGRG